MKLRRQRYHIIAWPEVGKPHKRLGTSSAHLSIMVYFADKWAAERGYPHMVIRRGGQVVHVAHPPKDTSKYVTPAGLSSR